MSVEECKAKLPLPDLIVKLGYGEADKKGFLPSPFRPGESGDSFHLFERGGQHFFKDHASGQGGDEINFIKFLRGMDDRAAIELYHELAGVEWRKVAATGTAERGKSSWSDLGKPVATYVYQNDDGSEALQVLRFAKEGGGKTFRQRRRARLGERSPNGWIWRVDEGDRVLYRLPELLECPVTTPIFLVEGEKCVEALVSLGLVATCNVAGAGKWQANYTASLAGKWVVMIGDNDEPGRKHVADVSEKLRPVVARLGIIDIASVWPGCPDKGDVADWVEAMGTNVALKAAERN